MNTTYQTVRSLVTLTIGALVLISCASTPDRSDEVAAVRMKLNSLQADGQLAVLAPVEIQEAERALRAAENTENEPELTTHLLMMASNKVDIARAWAQSRLYGDQRKQLTEQRDRVVLDARTREANTARFDAERARADAIAARDMTALARSEAEASRRAAAEARTEAESAQARARSAQDLGEAARLEAEELQRQITELEGRNTDRGLVVTLGDVLFETNKSELKGTTTSNLNKLAAFLNRYEDRTVTIEGHTDSVGSEDYNMALSQRRAEAVRSYLISQGIAANRLSTYGKGMGSPVSSNDSATGRQQNRRVEVIISEMVSSR